MRRFALLILLSLIAGIQPALGILPPFMPDEALAQYPVIVVAHWGRTPVRGHHNPERSRYEAHTQLVIDRVIKGSIQPGKHPLLIGAFIGWSDKGGRVGWFTGTEACGPASEVKVPNLWFLSRRRSWDRKDPVEYLCLDHYAGVQPLKLEPYFRALISTKPREEVPKLLTSSDPELVNKALYYVCNEFIPWPPFPITELPTIGLNEPGGLKAFLSLRPPPEPENEYTMSTAEWQAGYRWRDRKRVVPF